ncbi:antitoxin Xre/MbcA/ParS toxin-binding domain-containing protein, partial [Pseudomonas hunanensis]|uniref:antitoxin Xre/MbcA/ParS toxin-binding domain-containing protein n=1 Tax=Pseudomonas hunanensis TaxID=1247546 RepID=UPI003803E3BC
TAYSTGERDRGLVAASVDACLTSARCVRGSLTFGDQNLAIDWLSRPLRVLGQKRPIDLPFQDAIELIKRMENGYGA